MSNLSWFYILVIGALHSKQVWGCQTSMSSEGVLKSPGHPFPYPMSECTTTITAPVGMRISLTLLTLDTYKLGSKCNRNSDKVVVSDKPASNFVKVRKWCGGPNLPTDNSFTSTSNQAKVTLKPRGVDGSYVNHYNGFEIAVAFVGGTGVTTEAATTTTVPSTTPTSSIITTSPSATTTTGATTTSSGGASCGQSKFSDAGEMALTEAKIIGGTTARAYEFPWLALLIRRSTGQFYCGGTILSKRLILTAAHCVTSVSATDIEVAVHVNNADTRTGAQILNPVSITSHNNFNSMTFKNDIALIELNQDIVYNNEVQPVCLPSASNLYENRVAVIAGWGRTDFLTLATYANFATVNTTTNDACNDMMEAALSNPLSILTSMMCATDNEDNQTRDTCQGDSGGPMMVKEADGSFHVVGITSWGYGCASGTPGVYTRVSSFLNWIQNNS